MSSRAKKILELALTGNKQASMSTQDSQPALLADEDFAEESLFDYDSGSSDEYFPSATSNSESSSEKENYLINDDYRTDTCDDVQHEESVKTIDDKQLPKPRKRRRKANPAEWKRFVVKRLRMNGKAYINRSGKQIMEKRPKKVDCSTCRFKCNENFSETLRIKLCEEYWGLGNDKQQKIHLSSLITNKPVCRRKNFVQKERKTSREFFLNNCNGQKKRVCLKFLCATLSISHRVVELCMKNISESGMYIGYDGRSQVAIAHNSTSEEQKINVKAHIDSFPRVESHYCRKDSKKLYLSPDLNLSVMYRLYRDDYCQELKIIPVSLFVYRSIFKSYEPALSFYIPKKDQCAKCNAYQAAADKLPLQEEWDNHKKRESDAMKMKAEDKNRAIEDGGLTFRSITFDLQAILSVPYAGDSQIYYKRKLNVYNFTIMDASRNDGFCYVWDECNGKKGSIEIGSCILKYILNLPDSVSHITSFSDTCGGQNRNQFVTAAMLYVVNKKANLETVDLKFMESGHSYLECDSMHATIERKRKHKKVYTTREWALLISTARINPRPYQVTVMSYNDFYDLKELTARVVRNVSVTVDNKKVNWLKIKWIRMQKCKPLIIQFKYDLSEESFFEIDISQNNNKKTRIQKKELLNWSSLSLTPAYQNKLPVSEKKKNDLLSLLDKKVIPEEYRHFIENIPTAKRPTNSISDDEDDEDD